ncbi:MAG: NUDIX domain-containing protein [SAR202 cluster bacterium]|nr:DNA mismatch repair protein MutT [Chloroflexota bacterium]MQG59324.1 NUDIX domain-containing protein [SAR202 cluster bacterium]MQG67572.1 NUDIX domain-containing protein [SAR202 cluster bacterium]HAL49721.1 DNA mismatch repair protein MutT [Dehalococcoidia bacterium]
MGDESITQQDNRFDDNAFCGRCGGSVKGRSDPAVSRPYCSRCGHVVYLDPKLAAVVLVCQDNALLMVQRAIAPMLGHWSFPSGYVDRGEVVEDAAVREVREETNVEVELLGLIGLYSGGEQPVVLAAYAAQVTGGELTAGPETQDVGYFSLDRLPPLPFPHDPSILADWRRQFGST